MNGKSSKNTEEAFRWIVTVLQKHRVPFQISGGFAAKIYGSPRPLNDIDIDIPDKYFPDIITEIEEFTVCELERYVDERWDNMLITLDYKGQEIDISGITNMKICDVRTGKWKKMRFDLARAINKEVFGITVPVIAPKDLINYKSMLKGDHQKIDIAAVFTYL